MRRTAVAVLMLCASIALGAQASRMDFVRGVGIRTEAGGSLYRVLLPDDVYDTTTRADLADMRVLNAAGDAVPHTLRQVPRAIGAEAEWRSVPSFPMTDAQSALPARTHVRIGADGAVLEVTNERSAGRATTSYLIDASGVKEPLAKIGFTWDAAPGVTFLAPVSVSASDDLNRWRTVVSSAAIAQLQRDAFTLTQKHHLVMTYGAPIEEALAPLAPRVVLGSGKDRAHGSIVASQLLAIRH